MLKRSVAIVLMMLYICTAFGFVLNFHYCFDRLSSVKVDAPAIACTKVLQTSKMKCCKDRHIEVKVKDAHQSGSPLFWGKLFPLGLINSDFADVSFAVQNPSTERLLDRGPPRTPDIPIFLKNCTFRI
jgi:hypothetical protein